MPAHLIDRHDALANIARNAHATNRKRDPRRVAGAYTRLDAIDRGRCSLSAERYVRSTECRSGTTWVPVVPDTSAAASDNAPIAARAPVAITKEAAAATFGAIDP